MRKVVNLGKTWVGGLVVAAVLASACESGEGASSSTGGKIDSTAEFVAKLCAEFTGCCKAAGLPSDGVSCRALYSSIVPKADYNANAAGACVAELHAAGDAKCAGSLDALAPSCDLAFGNAGTKKPGETCSEDDECAVSPMGKVECATRYVDNSSISKCQVTVRGKEGNGPCVGTVDGIFTYGNSSQDDVPPLGYLCYVNDELTCSSSTDTCVAQRKIGESCSFAQNECVVHAYCNSVSKQCAAKGVTGAACKSDTECLDTHFCDSGDKCGARLNTGAACTENSQCLSDSCTNKACKADGLDNFGLIFLCGSN
jgi:hypothetical protein